MSVPFDLIAAGTIASTDATAPGDVALDDEEPAELVDELELELLELEEELLLPHPAIAATHKVAARKYQRPDLLLDCTPPEWGKPESGSICNDRSARQNL